MSTVTETPQKPAVAAAPEAPPTCASCGAGPAAGGTTFKKCSRCKSVRYCGRDCQQAHFADHKVECKAVVAERVAKVLEATGQEKAAG